MPVHNRSARGIIIAACLAACLGLGLPRAAQAAPLYHIVQPGENLFRIGLQYGVSWQAIMQANGLADTAIYVGQALLIPVEAASAPVDPAPAAPTPAPPATPPPPSTAPAPTQYTVQPGDTLFRIATRFGFVWTELAAANGLANPALLYPGQTLTMPAGAAGVPAAGTTAPSHSAPGKHILVDLSEQHLYAYAGAQLVFSFVASTGAPGMATQPGRYQVQSKIPNAYGGNWNIWMPNWLGIYWAGSLENGIHALPILPGGGRLWDGYLGTPVSYGCVILSSEAAQQLYDWAELGTPVEIQY